MSTRLSTSALAVCPLLLLASSSWARPPGFVDVTDALGAHFIQGSPPG